MRPCHILLTDDDVLGTEALKEHLEARGYRVTVASNGAEARKVLGGPVPVDIMILDYMMPDELGTELLLKIAEDDKLQKPRVIFSSSWIDDGNPAWRALRNRLPKGYKALVQAFVNKPYTFERMDAMVHRVARHAPPARGRRVAGGDFDAPPPTSLPPSETSAE